MKKNVLDCITVSSISVSLMILFVNRKYKKIDLIENIH